MGGRDHKRQEWLRREVPRWDRAGWLTEAGRADLLASYDQDAAAAKKAATGRLRLLLTLLGATLLLGGAIVLLVELAGQLPAWSDLVVSFLPLLVAQAFGAWVLLRIRQSDLLRESVGAALALALVFAIAYAARSLGLSFGWEASLFPVVIGLLLLTLYLFDSVAVWAVLQFCLAGWMTENLWSGVGFYFAAQLAGLMWYRMTVFRKPFGPRAQATRWVLGLSIAWLGINGVFNAHWQPAYGLFAAAFVFLYAMAPFPSGPEDPVRRHPWRALGAVGMILTAWVALLEGLNLNPQDLLPGEILVLVTFLLIGVAFSVVIWQRKVDRVDRAYAFLWHFLLVGSSLAYTLESSLPLEIVSLLWLFLLGALMLYEGWKRVALRRINLGAALILGLAAFYLLRELDSPWVVGIVAVISGSSFLFINLRLLSKLKTS